MTLTRKRKLLGIVVLFAASAAFVFFSQIEHQMTQEQYKKIYFVTWIQTSMLSCFLVLKLLIWGPRAVYRRFVPPPPDCPIIRRGSQSMSAQVEVVKRYSSMYDKKGGGDKDEEQQSIQNGNDDSESRNGNSVDNDLDDSAEVDDKLVNRVRSRLWKQKSQAEKANNKVEFGLRQTFLLGLWFSGLFLITNVLSNVALAKSSVSSNNILFQSCIIHTFWLSWIFVGERVTAFKIGSIAVVLGGVVLVVYADSEGSMGLHTGDLWVLVAAFAFSIYSTLIKRTMPDDCNADSLIFTGAMGLWILVLYWPVVLLLHYTAWEPYVRPDSTIIVNLILTGASVAVFNVLLVIGMFVTNALFVNVGLTLMMPLSVASDLFYGSRLPSAEYFGGTVLIFLGFIGVNFAYAREAQTTGSGTGSVGAVPIPRSASVSGEFLDHK